MPRKQRAVQSHVVLSSPRCTLTEFVKSNSCRVSNACHSACLSRPSAPSQSTELLHSATGLASRCSDGPLTSGNRIDPSSSTNGGADHSAASSEPASNGASYGSRPLQSWPAFQAYLLVNPASSCPSKISFFLPLSFPKTVSRGGGSCAAYCACPLIITYLK